MKYLGWKTALEKRRITYSLYNEGQQSVFDDWTEDREQQYQAGYKQGKVHTIAKWREDREQLQTEIELYSRHRVKLQADKAKLVKVLLETTNVLEWMSKHCYQQPLAKKEIAKARAVLKGAP